MRMLPIKTPSGHIVSDTACILLLFMVFILPLVGNVRSGILYFPKLVYKDKNPFRFWFHVTLHFLIGVFGIIFLLKDIIMWIPAFLGGPN